MNITVVLHRPQDLVNIAVVIRAMKNFGFRDLRLVSPVDFDVRRIEGIAHKTGDVAQHTEIFDGLDEALADFTCVAGLTARGRAAKRNAMLVAPAASELVGLAETERVAVLFGPEDKGLTNDDLDRCHRIVTIPTRSEHSSMNLAQAATVTCYELFKAAGASPELKRPRRDAPPASREQLEQLFADAEAALEAFEFFKSRNQKSIMRTIRELVHRDPADEREVQLLRAIALEVQRYLERKGV
ncbi:MAG: TrmJ/YjtD family RNA methyltransferase [Gemmatimonadetes bacterium]|nr:TrmJ/YjtD family RNA methyltransferase [Gemmatimonadota bacterium]